MMILNSTKYCACGVGAAISAFGKRKVDNNEVIIFKNAIELERFVDVDINLVKSLRKELGIDSNKKMVHHHFLW